MSTIKKQKVCTYTIFIHFPYSLLQDDAIVQLIVLATGILSWTISD